MRSGGVKVSVVLETDGSRDAARLGFGQALAGLARQAYPRELTELVVVDSGELPQLADTLHLVGGYAALLRYPVPRV